MGEERPAPIDAPKRLVTRGFYRYTRNPMYVAVLTVVVGWAVIFGAVILVAYAALLFVIFSLFIRLYEEPRLEREFGGAYATYVSQVGRWLPPASPRQGHLKRRAPNLECDGLQKRALTSTRRIDRCRGASPAYLHLSAASVKHPLDQVALTPDRVFPACMIRTRAVRNTS